MVLVLLRQGHLEAAAQLAQTHDLPISQARVHLAERESSDFAQISYQEWDRQAEPAYVSYQITGWVPSAVLTQNHRRH